MIDDAGPWKCELIDLLNALTREFDAPELFPGAGLAQDTQRVFLMERLLLVTALVTRKLREAGKISDQFWSGSLTYEERKLKVSGLRPDKLTMHRAMPYYQDQGLTKSMSYKDFADLIIHSTVFVTLGSYTESEPRILNPTGVAFANDRREKDHFIYLPLSQIETYILTLSQDDVVANQSMRDGEGGYVEASSNRSGTNEDGFEKFGRSKKVAEVIERRSSPEWEERRQAFKALKAEVETFVCPVCDGQAWVDQESGRVGRHYVYTMCALAVVCPLEGEDFQQWVAAQEEEPDTGLRDSVS